VILGAAGRWVLAALAVALLALAGPRLATALLLLEGGPIMARLDAGQPFDPAAGRRLVAGARAALAWTATPEAWRRLDAAGVAEAAAGRLTVAPTDPYAWARLAHRRLTAGDTAGARAAVRRSLHLGRWERPLIVDRLPVLAALAETAADRAALVDQLRRAWDWQRPRLLRRLPVGRHWPLYRRALAGDPAALSEAAALSGLFRPPVGAD
jgi:hypothetical protein